MPFPRFLYLSKWATIYTVVRARNPVSVMSPLIIPISCIFHIHTFITLSLLPSKTCISIPSTFLHLYCHHPNPEIAKCHIWDPTVFARLVCLAHSIFIKYLNQLLTPNHIKIERFNKTIQIPGFSWKIKRPSNTGYTILFGLNLVGFRRGYTSQHRAHAPWFVCQPPLHYLPTLRPKESCHLLMQFQYYFVLYFYTM